MTTQEMIAVMQAAVDGKAIEYRCKGMGGKSLQWIQVPNPTWDWHECEYRVKPREWWIIEGPNWKTICEKRATAERIATNNEPVIHVREVLE